MSQRIGVCSWSLQPASPEDLAAKAAAVGLSRVQLALDPLASGQWSEGRTLGTLHKAGLDVRSGMMRTLGEDYSTPDSIRRTGGLRPDEHWTANLAAAARTAEIARRLGIDLVTFHAGFLPEERGGALRRAMVERVRAVAEAFAACEVRVALETGQETAETLAEVLAELGDARVGVNFDPANMLLYGMGDPVAALRRLAPFVVQVHVKDAVPSAGPGRWGRETAVGEGAVDWPAFFEAMHDADLHCDLMIEREAGGSRPDDIRRARALVEQHLARLGTAGP